MHVFEPLARFCVNFLPIWVAPNLITLTSYICFSIGAGTLVYTCGPTLKPDITPNLALFVWACHFMGRLFDDVDGKQARRTGSASALGMLFDHGCDCLNRLPLYMLITMMTQIGDTYNSILFLTLTFNMFYLPLLKQYYTQNYVLPIGNGGSDGCFILYLSFFATYKYGPSFWFQTFSIPFLEVSIQYNNCIVVFYYMLQSLMFFGAIK